MGKNEISVKLTADTGGFSSSIGKATQGLKIFKQGVSDWTEEARKLDGGLAGLAGKFSALFGGVSTVAFAKSVFDAGLIVDRLNQSFTAITGSANLAQQELTFIKDKANELGLEFASSADAYKKLMAAAQGTPLAGKTRDIFLGIAEASTVLNLSAEQTEGALDAVGQMISKGNVQAEELRGQLGERLPGAFQLAAKAMGVTTQELGKLLEQGQVTAADMLPKLAKALHGQYGKAALEAGNSAAAGVNRFKNAWLDFRATVAQSGFMDVATEKIRDITNALNDPATQKSVAQLTTRFTEMAESALNFGINHGEAIAKIGGGLIVLSALSRTTSLLIGIWQGLNAAMLVTTGLQLIPYLANLRASLELTKIAALGATGALGAAAGGALAYLAGLNIGEQIYKATDEAEVALANLRQEIDLTAAKYRQFATFSPESQENLFQKSERDLEAYKQKLEGAFRYQAAIVQSLYAASRETNFWGQQTNEAKQAEVELVAAKGKLKEIEQAMDEYGVAAKRAHGQAADAAKTSAAEEKSAKTEALDKIKKKYQEYASTVKRLQDEIAGKERDLTALLREMERSGMSEFSAWKDRKQEAEDYAKAARIAEEAAQKAFASGNVATGEKKYQEAVQHYEKAKEIASGLNTEIREGDMLLQTQAQSLRIARQLTEEYGKKEIETQNKYQEAIRKTAEELNKQNGGKLNDFLPDDLKGVFGELTEKAADLGKKSEDFKTAWNEAWDKFLESGEDRISKLENALTVLTKDRTITVHVKEVVEKATGGPIPKFARGGKLPGYGGGDRVRALLEPGEFIIRKEAVAKYGIAYLQALNSMRLNDFNVIRARIGGLIGSANAGYHRFQQGGPVPAPATETINVNLNLPVQGKPVPFKIEKHHVREFLRQMEAMHRGRSS